MNANTRDMGPAATEVDWEDVQTYLAVARAGSLNGAAKALGVHHSTVFRRLERLEANVGAALFERAGSRYTPTAAGEALQPHAERVEDGLFALQRAIANSELMPTGRLRLTTLDSLLPWALAALATLEARCPDLTVELEATTATRPLDRREADMALRPSESPPPDAVGRRIAPLAWAVFEPCGCGRRELPTLRYLGPLAQLAGPQQAEEAAALPLDDTSGRLQLRSVSAMAGAIAHGFGRGALPCYIGDSDGRLRRGGPAQLPSRSALWLLLHPDLRHSARIRTLIDLIVPALALHAGLFAGERPAAVR